EVAGELAPVLRAVAHDVGDHEPSRPRELSVSATGLRKLFVIEGLDEQPEPDVLLETERMELVEVVELEPVVPHIGIVDVVSEAELATAPIDVNEGADRVEGAPEVEHVRLAELLFGELRRHRQDPVV